METITRNNMVMYGDDTVINNSPHGPVSKRSCLTNLLRFFYNISLNYDESRSVDFPKVFAKVPQQGFLPRLVAHAWYLR